MIGVKIFGRKLKEQKIKHERLIRLFLIFGGNLKKDQTRQNF
jgi:hypothetical protein